MTTAPKEGTHVTTPSSTAVQTGAMEVERPSLPKRIVSVVGVQNISLIIAIALVVAIIGIQNPLFFKENTRMIFGDAKATVQQPVAEFKDMEN